MWDNLAPHKAERVERAVLTARAELLPPYSPELSPIEPCWSKVKGHVRDVEPRDEESLGRAAAEGFASVTADRACGWFAKCRYCVQ